MKQACKSRHKHTSSALFAAPLTPACVLLAITLCASCQAADSPPIVDTMPSGDGFSIARRVSESGLCSESMSVSLDGFEKGDPNIFIEAPDVDVIRVTFPVEVDLTSRLVREEIHPPLRKSYCKIGIQTMVVDYDYPVEDDAVSSVTRRTIYGWRADERGTGWQIEAVGTRLNCSRERNSETGACL